jgi:hypothetical protein
MRYLLRAEECDRRFRGYGDAPVLRYDKPWSFSYSGTTERPTDSLYGPTRTVQHARIPSAPIAVLSHSPTVISSLAHPPPHASDTTDYTGWLPWQKGCVSSFHFTEWNLRDVALPPNPSSQLHWTCLPIRLKFRQVTYISVALNLEAFYITTLLSDIHRHCISYSCLFRDVRKL